MGSAVASFLVAFRFRTEANSHIHISPWIVPLHPLPYSLEQSSRCSFFDFTSIHARSQCCGMLIGIMMLLYRFKSSCSHRPFL